MRLRKSSHRPARGQLGYNPRSRWVNALLSVRAADFYPDLDELRETLAECHATDLPRGSIAYYGPGALWTPPAEDNGRRVEEWRAVQRAEASCGVPGCPLDDAAAPAPRLEPARPPSKANRAFADRLRAVGLPEVRPGVFRFGERRSWERLPRVCVAIGCPFYGHVPRVSCDIRGCPFFVEPTYGHGQ